MYTPCHIAFIITRTNVGQGVKKEQYPNSEPYSFYFSLVDLNIFMIKTKLPKRQRYINYLVIEIMLSNVQLCGISLNFGDNLYFEKNYLLKVTLWDTISIGIYNFHAYVILGLFLWSIYMMLFKVQIEKWVIDSIQRILYIYVWS